MVLLIHKHQSILVFVALQKNLLISRQLTGLVKYSATKETEGV